jgi:lipopolysaccharide export system protein LptA
VTAREATVGNNEDYLAIAGNVQLSVSDGLEAKAERATYSQQEGIVRAPGPVSFVRRRMSGSSIGMTYDKNRDVLWLLEDAEVTFAPDRPEGLGSEISSGAAGLARRDRYARFENNVRIIRGRQTAEADTATLFLDDEGERVQVVELRGHGRIGSATSDAGDLRAMTADDINLEYAPETDALRHAVLSNNATIEIGGSGAAPRRIMARWIDIVMAADGVTVASLNAREHVRLELPAEQDTPARAICGESLAASGEGGKGLTLARFREGVEYRELRKGSKGSAAQLKPCGAAAPGQFAEGARVATAGSLDLTFQPGFGTVTEGTFLGSVRFAENQLTGTAQQARYRTDRGTILLEGIDEQTRRPPQVTDGQTEINAAEIAVTLEGRNIVAEMDVRTVLSPARSGAKNEAKVPGMLKADQPVLAQADLLEYDGAAGHALYTGRARLWQGQTTIQATRLELDDRRGNLIASGSVTSTQMLEQRNQKTKAIERFTTVARGADFMYDDTARRASYKTKAQVTGQQGNLTADMIALYLTSSGNSLERLEAFDRVVLRDEKQWADGDRLTFHADDERYVMTAAPGPKLVHLCADQRPTTGKTLTFFKSIDRIVVDGNEVVRTRTTGGKCSELPLFD